MNAALQRALADRYRLERELGQGGMATVYLAIDLKHDRPVALKVLRPELAASLGTERFLREIRITARLSHAHILPLLDSGEAEGFLYYVMPYVTGESLRQRLSREGPLPLELALDITVQVASALDFAHQQGIIHRDIKPENILLSRTDAVLADFGIALAVRVAGGARLTASGLSLGTPEYMSPEQAAGDQAVDLRSDVYSLGSVLYELLVGEAPHTGATVQLVLARLLTAEPVAPRAARPAVPEHVDAAVLKALAKQPADRFATAGEFAAALAAPAPGASQPPRQSVAVLPFANLSADPENEYFADGITEDVITQLSKIRALRVISRTSVMRFKNTTIGLSEIGRSLGVTALLEGSVRRAGERVRIVAQLIDAETDRHLWADTYDRQLSDIFAIQSDVAIRIAAALRTELSPDERARIHREPTEIPEAYHLYLKGRRCHHRLTREGLQRALEYYREAIAKDPGYALAWVDIARAYVQLGMGYGAGAMKPADAYAAAKDAVSRALAIDDGLGEAHGTLALTMFVADFDWAAAEREFHLALALDPGSVNSCDGFGLMLAAQERHDEAVAMRRRAVDLDPLAPIALSDLATTLLRAGRYDEALREAQHLLDIEPDLALAHSTTGWAHVLSGRFEAGLAALKRAVELSHGNSMFLAQLGQAHAIAGNAAEARKALQQLTELARQQYVPPYHLAYVYTGLGELDRAMDCLEQAYEERAGGIYGIKGSFLFTNLGTHPRFQALLARINLA